jgi:hypothetical protein
MHQKRARNIPCSRSVDAWDVSVQDIAMSRVAGELARYFGPCASAEVRKRCFEALAQGDVGAVLTWLRILAAIRDHQAPQQASVKIYDRVSQISRRLSAYFHGHSFARRTEEL